jgi:hypothetical protein
MPLCGVGRFEFMGAFSRRIDAGIVGGVKNFSVWEGGGAAEIHRVEWTGV